MRDVIRKACLTAFVLVFAGATQAQPVWPGNKVVKIVVPFGAGTGLDVLARGFAERLGEQLNTPVVVENKEGAGGTIGTLAVARAAPDGTTLVFTAHAPFAVAPFLQSGASYDPVGDFAPVAKVAQIPMVLITGGNSRFKSFGDLVSAAKAEPGKFDYASSGIGTPSHLSVELITRQLGLDIHQVPYKSTAQAMSDVISGQIPLYMPSFAAALPQLKSGQVRGLAMGSSRRSAAMPDIPTVAELLKRPDLEAMVWYGFLAPKGTAPDILNRLYAEIEKAAATPRVREAMDRNGAEPVSVPPREFYQQIRNDADSSRQLLKALGLTVEK